MAKLILVAVLAVLPFQVAAKGCFLGVAEVTMSDGSKKSLADVEIGDQVLSWDEQSQKRAVSTVKAKPMFQRPHGELIEVHLPATSFVATQDHPFWSRSRSLLVSADPNVTNANYVDVEAHLVQSGEHFENEMQEAVPVDIRRPQSLSQKRFVEFLQIDDASQQINVMTLCLEPHHWYYVHGVRVHNKGGGGCFAPWTRVLMADETQQPISDVRISDRVVSWDEGEGRLSDATVTGILKFDAPQLMQMNLMSQKRSNSVFLDSERRSSEAETEGALVLTVDHPVFSVRTGGLVSFEPELTGLRYNLSVSLTGMDEEFLHHHTGKSLLARTSPWQGGNVSTVITLQLDRHHWFFAEGVRVHNKGGGGGRGGGGSSSGSSGGSGGGFTSSSQVSRNSYSSTGSYTAVVFVSAGSRRRYGTYSSETTSCTMASISTIESACRTYMEPSLRVGTFSDGMSGEPTEGFDPSIHCPDHGNGDCCNTCMACSDSSCADKIPGCNDFLSSTWPQCTTTTTNMSAVIAAAIVIPLIVIFFCGTFVRIVRRRWDAASRNYGMAPMEQERLAMTGCRGSLSADLVLSGTYSENGDTKPTTYNLQIDESGGIRGTGMDDDDSANVCGCVNIFENKIRWCEERPGVSMEVAGTINLTENSCVTVTCDYISSYQGTKGTLNLLSQASVVSGMVIGVTNVESYDGTCEKSYGCTKGLQNMAVETSGVLPNTAFTPVNVQMGYLPNSVVGHHDV